MNQQKTTSEYKSSFHGEGNFDDLILGEKQIIIIPAMQESFLDFDNNFETVKLYFQPTNCWFTLPELIEQINQIKETLNIYQFS